MNYLYNKYSTFYFSIINNALQQSRKKSKNFYFESHHIIPKSLGGSDLPENLVLLTAREHFICHWLLTKMFTVDTPPYFKMIRAFFMMKVDPICGEGRYIVSRVYENLKSINSKTMTYFQSGSKNSQHGTMWVFDKAQKKALKIKKKDFDETLYYKGRTGVIRVKIPEVKYSNRYQKLSKRV